MKRLALLALLPLVVTAAGRHMRYENIHDGEVSEIQQLMSELAPGAIVDIDSVYEGCSCEEGPACTDQVWVVSHQPGRNTGLWLSRMEGHWALGPYEKWQREIADLYRHQSEFLGPRDAPDFAARRDAYNQHMLELQMSKPRCEATPSASAAAR